MNETLPSPSLTRDRLNAAIKAALREPGLFALPGETSIFIPRSPVPPHVPVLTIVPSAPPETPVLWILESDETTPAHQVILRDLLGALPPSLSASLVIPGFFSTEALLLLRGSAPPLLRNAIADRLLRLGAFSASEHWFLTSQNDVDLVNLHRPPAPYRPMGDRDPAAMSRPFLLSYVDALEKSLEPVEQRSFGLKLWALQRNRSAFQTGDLEPRDYFQRLLDSETRLPPSALTHTRRFLEAASLESKMNFSAALRERNLLVEQLNILLDRKSAERLLQQTVDLAEGRLTPAAHGRALLAFAERAEIPAHPDSAYFLFVRYAELAETIDPNLLARECAELESSLFGPGDKSPGQSALLRAAWAATALKQFLLGDPSLENPPWEDWETLPETAESLSESVGLLIPSPTFPWEESLDSLKSSHRALEERIDHLVDELMPSFRTKSNITALPRGIVPSVQREIRRRGGLSGRFLPLPSAPSDPVSTARFLEVVWKLPRLSWSEGPSAARATFFLWANLLVALQFAQGREAAAKETARRFHLKLTRQRIFAREGSVRITLRENTRSLSGLAWKWTPGPDLRPWKGFHVMEPIPLGEERFFLSFRPVTGSFGPFRWVKNQWVAGREATKRFFQMQMESTLLAGIWMAGGVLLSAFAGTASSALVVSWLAVGVGVLTAIVLFGGNEGNEKGWLGNWFSLGRVKWAALRTRMTTK